MVPYLGTSSLYFVPVRYLLTYEYDYRNIDKKKAAFLEMSERSGAMRRAKKEAYFQYVYHTVAIEGNTMNLAQTRSILETKLGTVCL